MNIRSLACVLLAAAAANAVADDDPAPPVPVPVPAPDAAPAAPPAPTKAAASPNGNKCCVTLKNGRSFTGVVHEMGTWEKQDQRGAWSVCGKDDAGARVRLWYVGGREGFVGLAADDVKTVEDLGALEASEVTKIAQQKAAAEKQARDDSVRLHKEREERRATDAAKAAAAAKDALDPTAPKKTEESAAAAKAAADLLLKFPPTEWSTDTRDQIKQRALITHIRPTPVEQEFLDNFDAWAKAAAAARPAEAKKGASDPKTEGKPADSK